MKINGYISWFSEEDFVFDADGNVVCDNYDDPLKKRRIGVTGIYKQRDGTTVKDQFVTETLVPFSDEELQEWRDKKVLRSITLDFREKKTHKGNRYQACYLTAVNKIKL